MKNRLSFIVLALIVITVITTSCGKTKYTLDLPKEVENYTSITIQYNDNEKIIEDTEMMQDIINKLAGTGRTTTQKELGTPIDESEKIHIHFEFCKGGTSTIYVLQKDGKCYIEQDINGVYEISQNEYNDIKELIEWRKQSVYYALWQ